MLKMFSFFGFPTTEVINRILEMRNEAPLSARPSVTGLYFMNRDCWTVKIFTDDVPISVIITPRLSKPGSNVIITFHT